MKRILNRITAVALASVLAFSCVSEKSDEMPGSRPAVDYEGREITVYFGVEMPEPQTKTLGENPTISSLHVAVFGSSGYLKEYKLAEPVPANTYVSQEGVANKKGYKVSLSITSSRIRVHLIANGPETLDFDYESTVMSKLTSSGGQDAYWQRILLDHGIYADEDAPGYYSNPPVLVLDPDFDLDTDGVTHKMALIPLVRNFAKLTVVADDASTSNFTIDSFAVVNVPDKGSVAPYNAATGDFMMNYEDYPTLDALSAVYAGNMPSATRIDKSYPSEADFAARTNGVVAAGGAVYMYERPVPTADATVLIVKGTYTDPKTNTDHTGYYKIDMMDGGAYLPILRNFRYQINIQKVNRNGKNTVIAAINGAGSADISADISTASQVNLSDGNSAISVEYTEKTLPIGGTYTLGVSFTPDVSTGAVDNSLVTYELRPAEANGAVIASEDDISFDSSTGTLTYTTTDVDATNTKSQKIRVIGTSTKSRLYRDITIRLLPQQTMAVSCIPVIEAEPGTPQTVTITIPQDLPQSIFPLHFKVEVAAKTLTPNAGDLPVEPGETIVAGESGNSFQFIKTLSYTDYTAGYTGNVSSFNCEFKSIVGDSGSDIYVSNEYFATGSTSFQTFVKRYFSDLRFSTSGAVNEDDPVQFYFTLDAEHEGGAKLIPETVDVYLTGLYADMENSANHLQPAEGNRYVYTVPAGAAGTGTQTLYLFSTGETPYYKVELKASYYQDNEKTNQPLEFTNLGFSDVLYGNGWPTTFSFTIPSTYEITGGYIDIELGLGNLELNGSSNIQIANGKTYYRATSTGTKTINLKTTGNRTDPVSVTLTHEDFITGVGTEGTRKYLSIAARGMNLNSNSYRLFNNATAYVYSDKALNTQLLSFATTRNGNYAGYNTGAVSFNNTVLDSYSRLYLKVGSENATTTAEALSNGSQVTFSTLPAGTREITVSTINTNYPTGTSSYTSDDVTVAFSAISGRNYYYIQMDRGQSVSVSVPSGCHITSMVFTYYNNNYTPTSVTSSVGSYSTNNRTWTAPNNSTRSVSLTMTRNNNSIRIASIVVTVVDD